MVPSQPSSRGESPKMIPRVNNPNPRRKSNERVPRYRAPRACNQCRKRKMRCDGQTPCNRCVSRQEEAICCYDEHRSRSYYTKEAYESLAEAMEESLQVISKLYPSHTVSSLLPLSRDALVTLLDCQVKSSNSDVTDSSASWDSPHPKMPSLCYQQPLLNHQQPLPGQQALSQHHPHMPSQSILPDHGTFSDRQYPPSEQSFRSQSPIDQETGSPPTQAVWFVGCGYILSEYAKPCGCTGLGWPGQALSCCNPAA